MQRSEDTGRDRERVKELAAQTWQPEIAADWMTSPNGFLHGARPVDVLSQRGASEVIDALEATLSGAYA